MSAMLSLANRSSTRVRLERLRRDVAGLLRIQPDWVAADRRDFIEASARASSRDVEQRIPEVMRTPPPGPFHVHRFCLCCNETMPMLVDYQFGGVELDGIRKPNWRERLVCPAAP
jgi:hypothetical protein